MSNDDDDFDALARAASQPDSSSFRSSIQDRAGAMFEQSAIAKMVAEIVATGDFKVLRRPTLDDIPASNAEGEDTSIAAVVDVETTGLDPQLHKIIELALRRFRFDANGVITKIDRSYRWLEDPARLGSQVNAVPQEVSSCSRCRRSGPPTTIAGSKNARIPSP